MSLPAVRIMRIIVVDKKEKRCVIIFPKPLQGRISDFRSQPQNAKGKVGESIYYPAVKSFIEEIQERQLFVINLEALMQAAVDSFEWVACDKSTRLETSIAKSARKSGS